jgi:leucyl aminopeptidase
VRGFPTLRCEVLDEKAIVEQGLGLLHAVGKGAERPPRLLAIHYDGVSEARFAATSVKASPLIPADCGSRKAPGCTP